MRGWSGLRLAAACWAMGSTLMDDLIARCELVVDGSPKIQFGENLEVDPAGLAETWKRPANDENGTIRYQSTYELNIVRYDETSLHATSAKM
jgi:hypothetical protein